MRKPSKNIFGIVALLAAEVLEKDGPPAGRGSRRVSRKVGPKSDPDAMIEAKGFEAFNELSKILINHDLILNKSMCPVLARAGVCDV
jgi:hypothetical protein